MYASFGLWLAVFLLHGVLVAIFGGASGIGFREILLAFVGNVGWALFFDSLFRILDDVSFRFRRVVTGGIYAFLVLFLLTAFGFAKLYQRPFTWSFVRTDTISIWKANFISAFYELGLAHLFLVAATIILFIFIARTQSRSRPMAWRVLSLRAMGAFTGIVLSVLLAPSQPSLIANPLTASFRGPAKNLDSTVTVSPEDVIPELDALETTPPLNAIDVPRGKRKNVILYFLESTPFSVLGKKVHGKELTPNLNRLKERSLFFKRHYANTPLSINAFYNVVCSAYALPDGAWISLALPDFPVPCLSQILKKQNYRTIALHAGYLGYAKQHRLMQKRSFDVMRDAQTIKKPPYEDGMGPWGVADERSMIIPLTDFIAAAPKRPYLALLFATQPHHPYDTPADFTDVIESDDGLRKQQRDYFNSLNFSDMAFSTLFDELEAKGFLKDTILIVFGDHGEAFYEHRGNYNHPFFIYEENVHVPMLIYFDGVKPQSVNRVTSHVDVLPTVLDFLGLMKEQSSLHVGRSMLRAGPQSVAHLQAFWEEEFSGIVDQRYKYIRKGTGARELFDLSTDPGEVKNLAATMPQLAETYNQLTEKAFAQKRAYYKKYANYELTRFKPSSQDK